MTRLKVSVKGCDGWTVVELDVTEEGAAAIRELGIATEKKAEPPCEPIIEVEPTDPEAIKVCSAEASLSLLSPQDVDERVGWMRRSLFLKLAEEVYSSGWRFLGWPSYEQRWERYDPMSGLRPATPGSADHLVLRYSVTAVPDPYREFTA